MQLPIKLLESLKGIKGFDQPAFEKVHSEIEKIASIRLNPAKNYKPQTTNYKLSPVPWSQYGYYLDQRPSFTFDPLFHAGCYYVQEASSMFLEQALKRMLDLSKPLKILDLSAAPGGKSTHIHSLVSKDSLLVSNEVIRSRASVLKENIIKWGCENVIVTNNDPRDFKQLENYFDAIVVDAPCSGSGLFRRDPEAINEWSENNVQLCSQRQQRILMDCFPALKENGILIYSTCSYSKQEDEDIVNWLESHLPVSYCPLRIDPSWGITDTSKGYRFWPDKIRGEGFFLACFQKTGGEEETMNSQRKFKDMVTGKEKEILEKWIEPEGRDFFKHEDNVYAWPSAHAGEMAYLLERLKFVYSGILVGTFYGDKLVPEHALAMSHSYVKQIPCVELDYPDAIRYLQRRPVEQEISTRGWQLVSYHHRPLGWINALGSRVNNYYPKEMRILKDN